MVRGGGPYLGRLFLYLSGSVLNLCRATDIMPSGMGRSYWFECARCGYRAIVSGRADRGLDFYVQTILCRDCKALYDVVTRLRFPDQPTLESLRPDGVHRRQKLSPLRSPASPPSFQAALNRLPHKGVRHFRWVKFSLQCPVSSVHRVETWNDPDKCPRCGLYLERNVLPFRIWE